MTALPHPHPFDLRRPLRRPIDGRTIALLRLAVIWLVATLAVAPVAMPAAAELLRSADVQVVAPLPAPAPDAR